MSTVFCVIPTHNRLDRLVECIECLKSQEYTDWELIVIDDGSSDGTDQYINALQTENIHLLRGNGSLWWAGAMSLGIKSVMERASADDYLLMLNDDTCFGQDFLTALLNDSKKYPNAIVGALQKSSTDGRVLYKGFTIDYVKQEIAYSNDRVDALPGRGTFIPISILKKIGSLKSLLFPHFLGDLEFTARALDKGFQLISSDQASITTDPSRSDHKIQSRGLFWALFHSNSRRNIFYRITFFSIRGPILLRVTAIPRYILTRSLKLFKLLFRRIQ